MKHPTLSQAVAMALGVFGTTAYASEVEVTVTIENLAPANGTNQTPHWVGFHDGTFDLYDGGTPANSLPIKGSRGIEQLAEDGNNSGVAADFLTLQPGGVDATIAGPNGPIAPGDVATMSFTLDSSLLSNRYFSYGSMVLPSNDFWYANGNPKAHQIFDENGNFIAQDFIVANIDVLDAGTEINDEIPANTAFFGQQSPNTGVDENGVILDFGDASGLVAFRSPANGGNILADERFAMADFALDNYPLVKISFAAEEVTVFDDTPIGERLFFSADLDANNTVPLSAFKTFATGVSSFIFQRNGNQIRFGVSFIDLEGVTAAHLHLGPVGETGPVIANLLPADFDANDADQQSNISQALKGDIRSGRFAWSFSGSFSKRAGKTDPGRQRVYKRAHDTKSIRRDSWTISPIRHCRRGSKACDEYDDALLVQRVIVRN